MKRGEQETLSSERVRRLVAVVGRSALKVIGLDPDATSVVSYSLAIRWKIAEWLMDHAEAMSETYGKGTFYKTATPLYQDIALDVHCSPLCSRNWVGVFTRPGAPWEITFVGEGWLLTTRARVVRENGGEAKDTGDRV